MNLFQKILNVQVKLKCAKTRYNSFGDFKYRSCEDILDSLKPLLAEEKLLLIISDKERLEGDHYYIRAIARIFDVEKPEDYIESYAVAREDESRPKMSNSQLTGSASSYACKYALNGLFLIDDTRDADTDEFAKMGQKNQDNIYCESCNAEITTEKAKSYYLAHPNAKILCFNCSQKNKKGE